MYTFKYLYLSMAESDFYISVFTSTFFFLSFIYTVQVLVREVKDIVRNLEARKELESNNIVVQFNLNYVLKSKISSTPNSGVILSNANIIELIKSNFM